MLELVISKQRTDFDKIVGALSPELGTRFPSSINNWCGIGNRPYPLSIWEIFLAKCDGQIVGICSYYRQVDDPTDRMWVGWIGILPEFRRHGFGSELLLRIESMMLSSGASESWVYVDENDETATKFYASLGYKPVGTFEKVGSQQAAATKLSAVFMKHLKVETPHSKT